MAKVKKDHRDFEILFTWGMSGQYENSVVYRSTNKQTPLLSVIKRLGSLYFRCKIKTLSVVHSESTKTKIPEFTGIEPLGFMGDNYEAIGRLIKDLKLKYKNII